MLCNRPTCTETGAALALPGTLQERDTPAPPRAGVVTLPLPIRLRSCAGRAAGPTPAAEPQPGSHREPGARESQYPGYPRDVWGRNDHRNGERTDNATTRCLLRVACSPRNWAVSATPEFGSFPCFSAFSRAPPLRLPAVQRQIPAMVRWPAPELEVGCFRFAYAAPRCHQAVEANTGKAFVQRVTMMRNSMPTPRSAGLGPPSLCAIAPSITA